jgi:hypothetical protein
MQEGEYLSNRVARCPITTLLYGQFSGVILGLLGWAMQDSANEFPRRPIPRTSVNKDLYLGLDDRRTLPAGMDTGRALRNIKTAMINAHTANSTMPTSFTIEGPKPS